MKTFNGMAMIDAVKQAHNNVASTTSQAAKGAAKTTAMIVGIPLLATGAVLDLHLLITTSIQIQKGSPSDVADDIEKRYWRHLKKIKKKRWNSSRNFYQRRYRKF